MIASQPDIDRLADTLGRCVETGRWSAYMEDNVAERMAYRAALNELVARLKAAEAARERFILERRVRQQAYAELEADRDRLIEQIANGRREEATLREEWVALKADRDRLQRLLDQLEAIVTAKQPPDEVFRFFQRLHGLPEVGAPDTAWGPDHPSYDEMGQ